MHGQSGKKYRNLGKEYNVFSQVEFFNFSKQPRIRQIWPMVKKYYIFPLKDIVKVEKGNVLRGKKFEHRGKENHIFPPAVTRRF